VAPHLEITEGAERVILRAMHKSPDRRHQSMDEFRAELQKCYGSIAYKRHATSVPGVLPTGREARRKRLTEELDDWLSSDQSSLTEEEARQFAMDVASQPIDYDTGDEADADD
jgi:hypothetical protein